MMQEQGEQNYEAQEVPQQNGETSYDGEESEEALSQDQNTYGEGEYDNNTATNETFNTANDDELESLMADDVESEENEIMADSENMTDEPLNNTVMADNNVAALDETTDSAYESETEESAPMAEAAPVAQVGDGLPEMGSKMSYIVKRGETLSVIAQNIYGDMNMWQEMATLTGMENPNRIYPGDVVYYQLTDSSVAFATAYENVERAEVVVQSGDTLASISENVYGDAGQWKSVWRQNDQIDNPDRLEIGQVIYFVNMQEVMAQTEIIREQMKRNAEAVSEKNSVEKQESFEKLSVNSNVIINSRV